MKPSRPGPALVQQGLEQEQLAKMLDGTVNMLPSITQTELLREQLLPLRQLLQLKLHLPQAALVLGQLGLEQE
jgi:hypothetical protein